jgi:hypothetical protein
MDMSMPSYTEIKDPRVSVENVKSLTMDPVKKEAPTFKASGSTSESAPVPAAVKKTVKKTAKAKPAVSSPSVSYDF